MEKKTIFMDYLTEAFGIFLIEPVIEASLKQTTDIFFCCKKNHKHQRALYYIVQNINKNDGKFYCHTCAMHDGSIKCSSADKPSAYVNYYTTEKNISNVDEQTGERWIKLCAPLETYAVSDFGRVQNTVSKKILSPEITKGYYRVCLSHQLVKTKILVHRLVASAFLPNLESDDQIFINHKDGNKLNNVVFNLEWCSQRENMTERAKETRPRDMGYSGRELLEGHVEWRPLLLKNGKSVEISNTGLIRVGKYVTNGQVKNSYRYFNEFSVHRLVAEAFLGLPPNHQKLIVNHKNGNKEDNRVANLEWITHSQNSQHAADTGLMDEHKRRIRQYDMSGMFIKDHPSQAEAARELKTVSEDSINLCLRGVSMSAGNFIWRYADVEDVPMAVDAVLSGKCKVEKCSVEDDHVVETFESITEAAKNLGISFTQTKRMIDSGKSTADGLFFLRFPDGCEKESKIRKERQQAKKVERVSGDGLTVVGTWQSMKKAAKDAHMGEATVKKLCETKGQDKEGFLWRFA